MLSRAQVESTTFERGRRGRNYDEIAVDDFLERVAATLGSYESGEAVTVDAVSAAEVQDVTFTAARGLGRVGYDADAVDALLRQTRETLRVYESRSPGTIAASTPRAERPSVTPSAVTRPEGGFFSRLFTR